MSEPKWTPERLRELADEIPRVYAGTEREALRSAAAEIERLRAALARARGESDE